MDLTPEAYQQYVKQKQEKSPLLKDTVLAFLVGGSHLRVGAGHSERLFGLRT